MFSVVTCQCEVSVGIPWVGLKYLTKNPDHTRIETHAFIQVGKSLKPNDRNTAGLRGLDPSLDFHTKLFELICSAHGFDGDPPRSLKLGKTGENMTQGGMCRFGKLSIGELKRGHLGT